MFGRFTKRAKQNKGAPHTIFKDTLPGQCVRNYQMESSMSGFITKLKPQINKHRYKYAMIFVDNFSGYTYVHIQETITSADTVTEKASF